MIPFLVRPGRVAELAKLAAGWDAVSIDAETTGLKTWLGDSVLGFGIGELRQGEKPSYYYLPISHFDADNIPPKMLAPLRLVLAKKRVLGWNLKFDLHALAKLLKFKPPFYDVLPLARIMSTEERPILELNYVASSELGYTYQSEAKTSEFYRSHIDWEPPRKMKRWSVQEIGTKCCEDVHCAAQAYLHFSKDMPESLKLLYRREIGLTEILYEMERRGIRFDPDELEEVGGRLEGLMDSLLADLRGDTAQELFNPRSSPQVEAVMEGLKIKPRAFNKPKQDGTQSPKWDRDNLLVVGHPVALGIAQYRALGTQTGGFISLLREYVKLQLEIMHFSYQNWGTVTGRLSAKDPNVQAMAKGWLQLGELGEEGEALAWSEDGPDKTLAVRTIFIPRPGYAFLDADYSQIEMFIAGWYMAKVGHPELLELCQTEDVHRATALLVWGSEAPEFRKRAKWFNFGLLYGLGLDALALRIGCSLKEATKYREQYYGTIGPGYYRVMQDIRAWLDTRGYVQNVYGRRYYIDVERAYIAFNYMVQGSVGDFVKFREARIRKLCRQLKMYSVLTTHDDILFEVPLALLDSPRVGQLVNILEDGAPFGMRLPLKLTVSRTNLAEMEDYRVRKAA